MDVCRITALTLMKLMAAQPLPKTTIRTRFDLRSGASAPAQTHQHEPRSCLLFRILRVAYC